MKIVINRCWGGFGISDICFDEYLTRKGIKHYVYYIPIGTVGQRIKINNLFQSHINTKNCRGFIFSLRDYGKITNDSTMDVTDIIEKFAYIRDEERSDPILISVIEDLGVEVCSGYSSELEIVEIPDDVEYEITDYDGVERVEEVHRVWC